MSEWVRDYYRAVDGMDVDGYLAWHTDDVRFRFGNGPTTIGKEAIRDGLTQFWGSIAGLRHDFVQIWDTADASILEATTMYTRKDGSEVGIPVTTILRRRGDLVADIRIFIDLAPLFAPSAPQPEQQPAGATAT